MISSLNSGQGNKDIFISPPEQQRPKPTEFVHEKLKPHELDVDKENQFDMSSIMENIFEVGSLFLKVLI